MTNAYTQALVPSQGNGAKKSDGKSRNGNGSSSGNQQLPKWQSLNNITGQVPGFEQQNRTQNAEMQNLTMVSSTSQATKKRKSNNL